MAPNPTVTTPSSDHPTINQESSDAVGSDTFGDAPALDAQSNVVASSADLPLHCLPGLPASRVRRKPGRPKRIRPAILADEAIYRTKAEHRRRQQVALDPVVAAVEGDAPPEVLLHEVVVAVAGEAASLAFDLQFSITDENLL
ncbi:MAG: hypothetical protein ACHREM_23685, partial [Polyangiales bacterium]